MALPVRIPAAAAAPAPPAKSPEDQIALQTRRKLLLQYAVRINHQIVLLPHSGDREDRRDTDDKGRPINSLIAITSAVKMLSVELRHEYPLPADAGVPPDAEQPQNVTDDPLAGILLKFPEPTTPPAKPRSKKSKLKPRSKTPRTHE